MEILDSKNGLLRNTDTLPQWAQKFIAHLQAVTDSLRGQIELLKAECPQSRITIERTGPANTPVFLPEERIRFKIGDDEIGILISSISKRTTLSISSDRNPLHVIPWCSNVIHVYSERE